MPQLPESPAHSGSACHIRQEDDDRGASRRSHVTNQKLKTHRIGLTAYLYPEMFGKAS
jgi:hypothetical protein